MRVFAYVVAAHVLAFGMSGSANAADMFSMEDEVCGSWKDESCEKPALWTGAYVGGFIGGGWGNTDIDDTYTYDTYDPLAQNSIELSVLNGGVYIGYNVQRDNFVYGIEAGLGFMNFDDSVTDTDLRPDDLANRGSYPPIGATYSMSGNLYGELTGRLGYAKDKGLLYLKGGAAFLNADFDAHYFGNNYCTTHGSDPWCDTASTHSTFDFGKSDTLLGWTLGIGLEYALSDSMSLRAEYQHFDFGTLSYKYDDIFYFNPAKTNRAYSTLTGDLDADVTLDVVKLGVNYKLQDEYDALK
jgi:outer membrane immunogenic protein